MTTRTAILACGVALALAAGPAQASGDHHRNCDRREPAQAPVEFTDGTARWLVSLPRATSARWLARNRPCLTIDSGSGGARNVCVKGRKEARVTRPDGTAYSVPIRAREQPAGWRITLRQADLQPEPGTSSVTSECPDGGCESVSGQVSVPHLRVASCTARRPWFVHDGPDVGRAVALTFDDGPGPETHPVLRILRRYDTVATFFQLGIMVEQEPGVLRTITRAGHAIGNHSFNHPVLHAGDRKELTRTNKAIVAAGAPRPCLFRAPYGENPPDVVAMARAAKMVTVNWNTDPGDWRGLSADQIVATTLAQVRPGSIVVLHDGVSHPATVQALPRLITELQQRGYRMLTVPELLRLPVTYR